MNKKLKYGIWLILLIIVAYNSVYFKKLDSMKAAKSGNFDAVAYAHNYLNKMLPAAAGNAVDIDQLLAGLKSSPQKTFDTYSKALDIGSIRFFLVKGKGKITNIDDSDVYLSTAGSQSTIKIATEYIFGNAVRDASGLIHINDFNSTTDLNNISAEANKIIRQQIVPAFKAKAKKGDDVEFFGAIELNSSHPDIDDAEIIPVSLNIIH
jgi:predicted lipoprotein